MKKIVILFVILIHCMPSYCGIPNKAKLTSVGYGSTHEEARLSCIRNAVEQACGAFVFAANTIEDDSIIVDKILTTAGGKVSSYKELSCVTDDHGTFIVSADVSIGVPELFVAANTVFAESSLQIRVSEIKDNYRLNKRLDALYKQNEDDIVKTLVSQIEDCLEEECFVVSKLSHSDPIYNIAGDKVKFILEAKVTHNRMLEEIDNLLYSTIKSLSESHYERAKITNEGAAFQERLAAPSYHGYHGKCKILLSPENIDAIKQCMDSICDEVMRYGFTVNGRNITDAQKYVTYTKAGAGWELTEKSFTLPKTLSLYYEDICYLSGASDNLNYECKRL